MEAVVIFEDEKWVNFKPLTWTRPVCLLRTGIFHLVGESRCRRASALACRILKSTSTPAITSLQPFAIA